MTELDETASSFIEFVVAVLRLTCKLSVVEAQRQSWQGLAFLFRISCVSLSSSVTKRIASQ